MTRGLQTRVLGGWPETCVSYAEAGSKGIENTIGRPSSLTFTLKLETALSLLRASSRAMSQAYANAATSSLSVAECSAWAPFSHAHTVKKYSGIASPQRPPIPDIGHHEDRSQLTWPRASADASARDTGAPVNYRSAMWSDAPAR
jgi:hypothetical protein